jgi:hypothetical protein
MLRLDRTSPTHQYTAFTADLVRPNLHAEITALADAAMVDQAANDCGVYRTDVVTTLEALCGNVKSKSAIEAVDAAKEKLSPATQDEVHPCHGEAILLTGAMNALTDQETFNAFRLQTAMRCFERDGQEFFTDPDMR